MEDILNSDYWRQRIISAREEHHAIFKCPLEEWKAIAEKHKTILAKHIDPATSILDIGCGWGRLLQLLPISWRGSYVGVDLCTEFIDKARYSHPSKLFANCSVSYLDGYPRFDIAICVSFRPMVKRNLGEETWRAYEAQIRRFAGRILYLEYDKNDEGSLE